MLIFDIEEEKRLKAHNDNHCSSQKLQSEQYSQQTYIQIDENCSNEDYWKNITETSYKGGSNSNEFDQLKQNDRTNSFEKAQAEETTTKRKSKPFCYSCYHETVIAIF